MKKDFYGINMLLWPKFSKKRQEISERKIGQISQEMSSSTFLFISSVLFLIRSLACGEDYKLRVTHKLI